MTLTIEIGKGRTIGLTEDQLTTLRGHDLVFNRIVHIGLKNILSDANASVARKNFGTDKEYSEAAFQASMKKLDAMLRGEYRTAGTTVRAPSDPVGQETMRLARVFINGKAHGWEKDKPEALTAIAAWAAKLSMPATNADERKAVIAAAIKARAARDDVRKLAQDNVDAQAKISTNAADDL